MQWSYHLRSTILATTSKFKMAVKIGVFRLIREALYFWSTITATTSKSCGSFKLTCQLFTRCNFNVHHSICTTLLYKKLSTKWKNMYLFSFYSTKCPARFNFQNAKSLDFSVLMYQWDILQWGKFWKIVVFFSKSWGFFLK